MPGHVHFRLGAWIALGFAATEAASGQNVLLAEYKDKLRPVCDASGPRALVEVDGKRVVADGGHFVLRQVDEYLPLLIAVRGITTKSEGADVIGTRVVINNRLEFRAEFSAACAVENVFLVLAMNSADGTTSIHLHEIGKLNAAEPKLVRMNVDTIRPLGSMRYTLHLFVGGLEVLHSEMPAAAREAVLDRMVAKRNAGRIDANPELFLGTPPEYPRKFAQAGTVGQVTVQVRVLPNGAVADASVVQASAPEFGEAAVDAVRQWRFLPKMKAGQPVTTLVNLPLEFAPPPKS